MFAFLATSSKEMLCTNSVSLFILHELNNDALTCSLDNLPTPASPDELTNKPNGAEYF
jgi:hypothetical protein